MSPPPWCRGSVRTWPYAAGDVPGQLLMLEKKLPPQQCSLLAGCRAHQGTGLWPGAADLTRFLSSPEGKASHHYHCQGA